MLTEKEHSNILQKRKYFDNISSITKDPCYNCKWRQTHGIILYCMVFCVVGVVDLPSLIVLDYIVWYSVLQVLRAASKGSGRLKVSKTVSSESPVRGESSTARVGNRPPSSAAQHNGKARFENFIRHDETCYVEIVQQCKLSIQTFKLFIPHILTILQCAQSIRSLTKSENNNSFGQMLVRR